MFYSVCGVIYASVPNGFAVVVRTVDGFKLAGGDTIAELPNDAIPMAYTEALIRVPVKEQKSTKPARKRGGKSADV